MEKIYDELKKIEENMATRKDVESLTETIEIMGTPSTMRQIADSMEDIARSRVKPINSVQDMLDEM